MREQIPQDVYSSVKNVPKAAIKTSGLENAGPRRTYSGFTKKSEISHAQAFESSTTTHIYDEGTRADA
jgi:hypothetical protein